MAKPAFTHIDNPVKSKNQLFTELVNEHKERVYWLVRKMVLNHEDANDVTQNVFLKVWKSLDKFKGQSSYYTWIHRIGVNESLNFLEKNKRKVNTSELNEHLFENMVSDPYFDGDEEVKKLHRAVLTLPDKQRLVFNLKYFENRKFTEIAELTDTSQGALKASYHLAVKKITNLLKNEDQ